MLNEIQRYILEYLSVGMNQAEVATALDIHRYAVEYQLRGIRSKLEAKTTEEAIFKATKAGLI